MDEFDAATGRQRRCHRVPFARSEGRSVFGPVAASYEDARPDYPERVFDILRERCGLGPSSRVLEIGAGSGKATRRLSEAGAEVVAVEPSPPLAEVLSAQLSSADGLEIVGAAFEDAHLSPSSFDLVVAATSFHWLNQALALPKIVSILRPGGWLALWWNVFGDPDLPDPFHNATEQILNDLEPSPSEGPGGMPFSLDVRARTSELEESGFENIEYEALRWTLTLDPSETRRLYATYSNIARLPRARREAILDSIEHVGASQFGGRVERQMVTPIYTARTGST
jgi:SAM-dependent methyltransferase